MCLLKYVVMYVFLFTFLLYKCFLADNKCFRILSNGEKDWHCCDNFEDTNGSCVECKLGYRSRVGEKCAKCNLGTYGRKCGLYCSCPLYQRCDHVYGCIDITVSTVMFTAVSFNYTKTTAKAHLGVFPENQLPIVPGFLDREIVIYTISAGVFTMFVCLGIVFIKHYRSSRSRNSASSLNQTPSGVSNIAQMVMPENRITEEREDPLYETIDESNLIDLPIQGVDSDVGRSSTSSDSRNLRPLLGDGSNNPYQPIVIDPELHFYSSANKVSSQSDSSSYCSEVNESGYLHPYQPIMTNVEVHEYRSVLQEFSRPVLDETNYVSSSVSICRTSLPCEDLNLNISDVNCEKYVNSFIASEPDSNSNVGNTEDSANIMDQVFIKNETPASHNIDICVAKE